MSRLFGLRERFKSVNTSVNLNVRALSKASLNAHQNLPIVREGWLTKQGGSSGFGLRNWKERWFILDNEGVWYYKNEHTKEQKQHLGFLPFDGTVRVVESTKLGFAIHSSRPQPLNVRAKTAALKEEWMKSLQEVSTTVGDSKIRYEAKTLTKAFSDGLARTMTTVSTFKTLADVDEDLQKDGERVVTMEDLTGHTNPWDDGVWIALEGKVYNISNLAQAAEYGGTDITARWPSLLQKSGWSRLKTDAPLIGTLGSEQDKLDNIERLQQEARATAQLASQKAAELETAVVIYETYNVRVALAIVKRSTQVAHLTVKDLNRVVIIVTEKLKHMTSRPTDKRLLYCRTLLMQDLDVRLVYGPDLPDVCVLDYNGTIIKGFFQSAALLDMLNSVDESIDLTSALYGVAEPSISLSDRGDGDDASISATHDPHPAGQCLDDTT